MTNEPGNEAQILIEQAKAKGLMSQAAILSARQDPASQEQARMLWEEALGGGRLYPFDELNCHYSLGAYFLSRGDVAHGLLHEEFVLAKDPDLNFLPQVDEATKRILKAELYVTTSAAFQSVAAEMAKGGPGPAKAIAFLQERIDLLCNRAAPCIFLEMSELNRQLGDFPGAEQALRLAIDAPTFNTESQEAVKNRAKKLLAEMPALLPGKKEALPAGPQDLDLGQIVGRKPGRRLKRFLWAIPAVLLIGATIFLAMPSPYHKHFKQAKAFFAQGKYSEALAQVGQARAKRSTSELSVLNNQIQAKLDEIKERERQAVLQRQYDSNYGLALSSFNGGRFGDAQRYALLAKDRRPTAQVDSLLSRIEASLRRQEAVERERVEREERRRQLAEDDAAYRAANASGTVAALRDYLNAFPRGRHVVSAANRISVLQLRAAQTQRTPVDQMHTTSRRPDPLPVVQSQQPTVATLRAYLEEALRRLAERTSASTPTRPNAPTVDISRAREREKKAWMDQTLRSIDTALGALKNAQTVAEMLSDNRAQDAILRWTGLTQKARDQLVSKKVLSDVNSFNNQKQTIKEIREYIFR